MKQNWEEKRIEELFREARQEDERLTPPFANLLEANPARTELPHRLLTIRPYVFVASVLLLLSFGAAFLFFREPKSPQIIAEEKPTVAPLIKPATPPITEPKIVETKPIKRKEVRRRATSRNTGLLISHWKPPTDFLLRFPGEKLLKTTPELIKPLEDMGPFLEEIQN